MICGPGKKLNAEVAGSVVKPLRCFVILAKSEN
jgi:hypothetical protein